MLQPDRHPHWSLDIDEDVKVKAQQSVSIAVKKGILVRPDRCDECERLCSPHGHHDDYDFPLQVRWLCPSCHRKQHPIPPGYQARGDSVLADGAFNLRAERQRYRRSVSQRELAKELSWGMSTIIDVEMGRVRIAHDQQGEICKVIKRLAERNRPDGRRKLGSA